ncbi:hypothetical protein PAXINDRAFT_93687 [Paxillus involutus ATCC 200175]|uniref:Unplaced genomic scaffold PAXINscaffold_1778, whole genome shotgun sequence n=1 Tax=Paxillus involutus ATCC 200175 TaxID=664439 RepID=A0A0C9T184_PAXIN|nr:hypothetical protein PAXINDRAFT_93687 [Paxillus involutus ATCC 200175]
MATKRPSPFPKAYERAKRATSTPHGPTPFPRPTSTPNGARRRQTAHPLSLRLTNMVSGPRTTRPLPRAHERAERRTRTPANPLTGHELTRRP